MKHKVWPGQPCCTSWVSALLTQCPGDTVQTKTGKVDPAQKFKCTTATRDKSYLVTNDLSSAQAPFLLHLWHRFVWSSHFRGLLLTGNLGIYPKMYPENRKYIRKTENISRKTENISGQQKIYPENRKYFRKTENISRNHKIYPENTKYIRKT